MIALKCRGLKKRYDEVVAVAGLDLEVRAKECFGLLGPNGAGKTTTTEMLEGLITPDEGSIEILGQSWGRRDRQLRERIGVALQETRLTERITVEESIRLFRSFYRSGREVDDVLEILGLEEKRRTWVEKLSGGQRQRLALACALVGNPDMLFLDEPTTGLDPGARHRIWAVIEEFCAAGGTVFLTTHYMEEAERLCHRVGIMDRGKLIALDTPQSLIDKLNAEQVIEMSTNGSVDSEALANLAGVHGVGVRGDAIVLRVKHIERVLPAVFSEVARQGVSILTLKTRRTTLEDVYVYLTGRGLTYEKWREHPSSSD
jgi:ABC-2 type transport system ATP-binding protein